MYYAAPTKEKSSPILSEAQTQSREWAKRGSERGGSPLSVAPSWRQREAGPTTVVEAGWANYSRGYRSGRCRCRSRKSVESYGVACTASTYSTVKELVWCLHRNAANAEQGFLVFAQEYCQCEQVLFRK